ncbi:uncharacterized protein LOC131691889 isoform X29 [Topomyia yanbarensis]|uniref:uncharacterized protein LOC131691889 isoform X29 n=1 Tax=Topomyia yanbarensis TaxID=2498891 RepID=UPI00273B6722|nr:uncharacterized protein LOC131691889 isoform X29 [Topomyia yanbarensis]
MAGQKRSRRGRREERVYEYDFTYEFRRFAESLQKPLRTYRVEFNLGRPVSSNSNYNNGTDGLQEVSEDVFTSTYSATRITKITNNKLNYDSMDGSTAAGRAENSRESSPTKKVSKAEMQSDVHHPNGASSVQFTEIRSLKRISRTNEAVGTNNGTEIGDTILNTPGIVDPVSGRILTVGEAIKLRILDVRSGQLNVNGERLSLKEAVRRQLIDAELVDNLLRPGAALDRDGRPMSLLEVIQKEILEAENGYDSTEKRIKVTTSKEPYRTVKNNEKEAKSIVDAIKQGLVDTSAGLYRTETGDFITLAVAYELGYLIRNETIKIAPHTLSLTDAIGQGLVDTGGWVVDRNTGDKFRLDSAIAKKLVSPDLREIVDTKNDNMITVTEAIEQGILNAKTGRYMNPLTKEKLTFAEARNRQLIHKPMTMKDVCDLNLFDKTDKIASPTRRERVNIPGAISLGVLDSDIIKCVYKTKGNLLTLKEALEQEIILPFENRYRHMETTELMTIPEAVDRGFISSVSIKSIFNICGFKDPHSGEFVSLNTALAKNIVRKKDGHFLLDTGKGVLIDLDKAVAQELIRPEVYEMLNRKCGVLYKGGHELSLFELVYHELIDTKTGFLLEPDTGSVLPLEPAIERKFITPEGALLLISLLNITLTTETVVKTIKRYVTITHTGEQVEEQPDILLSFTEAVRRGLIDENTRTYRDPVTGNVYSVQQALNHGLILPDTEAIPLQEVGSAVPNIITKPSSIPLEFETRVVNSGISKNISITTEFLDRERKQTQSYEVPPEGWLLAEAISKKLFDPVAGLFIIPGTDRLVSFEECIKLKIINQESALVVDPNSVQRKITLERALEKKVLDTTGHYAIVDNNNITMREAIDRNLVMFEHTVDIPVDSKVNRIIQITKLPGEPDRIEVANGSNQTINVRGMQTPEMLSPEPLQLAPGIIYDPSTALVIFTDSGKSTSIVHAVASGKIESNIVKINDPNTGELISIPQALERGVLDRQTGEIKHRSGKQIGLIEAAHTGALVVCGAPLVAAAGALDLLKTIIDPSTGHEIPIEVAYERGLITKSQLPSPERAALKKKISVEESSRRSSESFVVTVADHSKQYTKDPVVLQRMRKCVLRPKDAAERGILDQETANLLEDPNLFEGTQTLYRLIAIGRVDGNRGQIIDPQRGHTLTINEAIQRGILDHHGSNNIFIPLARSLAIPELVSQGLLNTEDSKIYHPESGRLLTLREAIICDIVDPLTEILIDDKQKVSLEQAIKSSIVDEDQCTINNAKLVDVINQNVFIMPNYSSQLPPAGMTLPVIVKRHLLDVDRKEIIHPISQDRMNFNEAIKNDFVMAVPYTPHPDATDIEAALDKKLINTDNESFKIPTTSEEIPLQEAIETGLLEVKPLPELVQGIQANKAITSVTESISSYHTITTKTVEIQSGYSLISATEVQDITTGEIMSVDEARQKGIISDENRTKEQVLNEEVNINFTNALQRGLLDVTKGTFRHPDSGDVMSISDAVDRGYIASKAVSDDLLHRSPEMVHKVITEVDVIPEQTTGNIKHEIVHNIIRESDVPPSSGRMTEVTLQNDAKTSSENKLGENIKNTAKLGLMAVVGAPVLGGMAIAGALKKVFEKKESEKTESVVVHSSHSSIVETTCDNVNSTTLEVVTNIIDKPMPIAASLTTTKETNEELVHGNLSTSIESSKIEIQNVVAEDVQIADSNENADKKHEIELGKYGETLPDYSVKLDEKGNIEKPISEFISDVINDPKKEMTEEINVQQGTDEVIQITCDVKNEPNKVGSQFSDEQRCVSEIEDHLISDHSSKHGEKTQTETSISQVIPDEKKVSEKDMTKKIMLDKGPDERRQLLHEQCVVSNTEVPSTVDDVLSVKEQTSVVNTAETIKTIEKKTSIFAEEHISPKTENNRKEMERIATNHNAGSAVILESIPAIVDTTKHTEEHDSRLLHTVATENDEIMSEFSVPKPENQVTEQNTQELPPTEIDSEKSRTLDIIDETSHPDNIYSHKDPELVQQVKPVDETNVSFDHAATESTDVSENAAKQDTLAVNRPHDLPILINQTEHSTTTTPANNKAPDEHEKLIPLQYPHKTSADKDSAINETGKKVLDAAKLGLMAIVGAPILAGKAVVDALKNDTSKQAETNESKPNVIDATVAFLEQERSPGDARREFEELQQAIGGIIEAEDTDGKLKTPEKHVTFEIVEQTLERQRLDRNYERMPLGEAVSQGKIIPKVCRVMVDEKEMPYTVEEGLNDQNIRIYDIVDVISKELISFVDGEPDGLVIDETLTKQKLIDLGVLDPETGSFISPNNGDFISFYDLICSSGLVDPNTVYVKDLGKNKYEQLDIALQKHLIDKHTGHMLDNKTGKKVKFIECCKRAWIIQREPSSENLDQSPTLTEVLDAGQFNPQTGELVQDNQSVPIAEALRAGFIANDSVSVRDPTDGEILPLRVAIERGIIDLKLGVIFNRETQEEIDLNEAYSRGYMLEGKRTPISLEAAVRKGLYNPESGLILDTITEEMVDVQQSVDKGIVDPKISNVKDSRCNVLVPLQAALDTKLLDTESGKLKDTVTDEMVSLDVALEKQLMDTKKITHSLIDVLNKEFYNPKSGRILNPGNGEENILKHAIDAQLVEIESVLIRDEQKDTVIKCGEAIQSGLLDDIRGVLTKPELTLDRAYQKGYILSNKKPISLPDALLRGFYDPASGMFRIDGASGITLQKAIDNGEISTSDLIVRDPKCRGVVSLADAIRSGLVESVSGIVIDSGSGLSMGMLDALDRGIIVMAKRRCSLPDAVFRGLYDPKSGQFSSTTTPEKMSTERAIRRGMLDPESTIVNVAGKILPFELAIENGTVDIRRGTIKDEVGNKIDFREAFDRGLLVEVRKPISLNEAVLKGIYRESSGLFMDPKTGRKMTLSQAIAEKVIDPRSVQIKDSATGFYKDLNLIDAIETDLINGENSNVQHGNDKITLKHAFDIGLLYDVNGPISLQRAIHQGIYHDQSGKIEDSISGRKITLHEAMRKFIINPQLPCYFNEKDEVMLNLFETCRAKLIDRREGVFKEPGSEVFIPLNEALALGLIVDIESAGFGLYETLAMGFYDTKSGKIIHPSTSRNITLEQACREDIVSLSSSIVKNTITGKYIRLDEAIRAKIIDDREGVYTLPKGNKIDLQEARRKGLIVTNQKLLSLEKAIKLQLYRQDAGTFVEPISGEQVNLQEALDSGLLDFETTVYKDAVTGQDKPLRTAIADRDIDVEKGKVVDRKSDRTYNFDTALNKGLLVTVQKPITGRILERKESIDNLLQESPIGKSPREMSLKDALRYDILSVDKSVIKHPKSRVFIPLKLALQEKLILDESRATIDPKQSFFVFDGDLIVYAREPLTFDKAVESSLLDLLTGKFLYKSATIVGGGTTDGDVVELLSLKDAIGQGFIDPESVLLKDGAKKKFLPLPEAFRKGLIDADKSNVLDTNTSKLTSLQQAVDTGLLITPKRAICLMEALNYHMYNGESGTFEDPFQPNQHKTLNETIQSGLIDPTTTMVRDIGNNSVIVPLLTAIGNGLINPIDGHFNIESEQTKIDLVKARDRGYLMLAEQRQAVVEKFALCEDHLSKLLEWITKVEQDIASVGGPKERVDDLRNQINSLKQIKDDIDVQSRPVASCLEQVRQLVLTGGEVLSAPEVAALESSGRELRSRVDKAQDRTGKLLRRLGGARDELGKLRSELDTFSTWLQTSRRTLEDKENTLSDLTRLSSQSESVKEFHGDVIAHQADLRFITMSAQKFVDECKDYLTVLNDFRTTLPERLPHIEQISSSDSPIRQEVSLVTAQYRDLLNRANTLLDRLAGLGGRQRDYQETLEKARSWLRDVQPRVSTVLSDPIAADPQSVQDQMNQTKSLQNEFLSQGRLIDNVQHSLDALLKSLAGRLSPSEVSALEIPVEDVKDKYNQLLEALGDRSKLLDTALVQSQGVQDALDGLSGWINQSEDKFKLQNRPASLIKERLNEQVREHRGLLNDLESHRTSLESVTLSARELMTTASNARLAKRIETNLSDVTGRFEKLLDKALKRGEFLEDTLAQLNKFNEDASILEQELSNLQEALEGRELTTLPAETLTQRMIDLTKNKEHLRPLYENCVKLGKDLISKRDVTDTGVVRDRVKALENAWKNLEVSLEEKLKLSKQKAEQLNAYEDVKDHVLVWLSSIETRTNNLAPVAVDVETIKYQLEEVKPLIKEHRDYAVTIDKVNDLGAQYDALIRPDSPTRKRSAYSPIKRSTVSPMRRLSGEARSPSPTKGLAVGQSPTVSPLSPGGSSGFGSRRSSQDGFQLTDLTPIQQQLTEINNRYSLVGARLNDRQNELDSVRDEVRKHQESLKTLASFLDKIQRQVPKDVISNKDEAERCNKQARKVLEEMYEKQSLLDSTKAQVKDILKRKPDVQGSDRLRSELDSVVDRWKNLHDLCKDRINFSEQLRDFLDTHDNLNGWLAAKERMLTVLGPISSDPRMVQSQVQQVQVLREEFRGQQPQLNHLQEVGNVVLEYLRDSSVESQSVSTKLKNVQRKWDDLVSRLDERAQSLGAAADTSKEFDAGLNRLREALQNISDNLDALPTDRDHQETLRKIENLERQLEGQRPLLADSEAAGEALCRVLSDPASRADVNARVVAVGKQYQNLQKKLDHRKAETDSALRDGRQFAETCARTLGWLSGELGNLTDRLLVSAHRPTLQHQIDTHEPVYREVMSREHEVIMLLNKGRELQEKPGQSPDRTVQRDLEKISQQWERLRNAAVDRHSRLQTCMEHCKKHGAASESFLTWLRGAEDKLSSFKPGILKKSQLDQQLKELQTFRSDVWKKSGEYESTRGLGESFIGACDIDKEPIKAELQDTKDRWERLNNELLVRAQTLESCAKRLGDFNDELRDLDHAVSRCEDRLAAHDALGGAAKDPKLLDRVKTIKDDATALKKPLQAVRKSAGDIAVEARAAGGDADHLKTEVDGIADRIEDLHARLDDRCGELQSAATAVSQFNDAVKSLGIDLNDLENQIDSLTPPAREIKTVINQLDEVASILSKIDRTASQVVAVERAGELLVDSGFATDTVATRDQIGAVRKQLSKLENRTRDHDDALQKALKALQKFYDIHQITLDNLNEVADQVKKLKPVSSELEQIRHQQEDFRRFKQRYVEPLVVNIDEVNRTGQDLIRSAQGGVPTGVLEKDLEKINDKWNDLKERTNERDRRLDVGLLQSGKFQEALDGLSKWLKDTEEMVANQKPPSADYKVVKAQLQEQKFLTKMLMDRQNSMSSLFQLGQEVAAGCEPSEKVAIERQLKELMGRFDALTDAAQTRTLDLEQAMHVAKQFQDQLNPLTKWLDGAERAVKAMELVPTDEEKIQQRILEHERLHDEILSKQPEFSELADIAGQLMELVGDDEGVVLSEKVKNTTDRYTDLVQASENIGQILSDSRQGLRHLVLTYQDLVSWMENMENRLQRFRIIPVHTEKLLEQMDVLVELNEDIASRSPNVESTVEAGSELMKHISSDEALQLKDKLDSLQRRYGELTTKGGDLLKRAQDALPLVQQFHQSHIRLVDWMQAAESTLATGDSNEIDIVRLEGDLSEMRPVLEAVNSIGPQLCQISPGEGASTIEGIVTRDNRRFEAIVEQIQRKAERLHLSKQRSNEVTADIDELLEWFRDMDATLRDAELPAMTPKLVRAQLQEHRSINDDISSQKGRVRDVTSSAKKVLRESQPNNNTIALREKLEDLKEVVDTVASLCSNRLAMLEQALPLSEHFADSHSGLVTWLNDMEHQISMLAMPALRLDQIAIQQDKNERLTQSIAEHKPLLDKLNKTGEALIALVADDDAVKISEIVESDNARYAALRTELRERQNALEQALQESSQFSDKLEGMLRALQNTAEQANQADPISAHPPKIRDQIEDNAALIEDIDKRGEAFAAVKRAATDVISKASNQSDPAVRDIKKKLDKLNNLWNELQKTTSKRGASLENTLAVADKFWKEMQAVMETLKELQEALQTQEPPAAQPQAIQKQQVALQEIRQEIDQTKPEVEQVRRTGSNLMSLCGEPDKPEVKKHIEDLDHAWDNITALYAKREENLIDAMEKAMEFHETLQNLLNFLAKAEDRFQKLGPLGSDIEAVKKQIEQLKHFKDDVDPHMVEVEALNRVLSRQAIDLTERTSVEQASAIREPLNAVNRRWENLLRGMVERQKQLEHALLHLGQFQHALNELLVWISKTDANLDELKPIPGDPQLLEVELAKLKVLANDIHAHQSSVDTLNDAGRKLIENDRGSLEASTTQDKLQQLNKQWRSLLQKAADRQHELEEALREAQGFTAEIQDLLGWLGDVDAVIGASKPVGGLPETASEQLERFMEVYNELEENRPKVETLIAQGQEYVRKQTQLQVSASNLQHTLRTLKQRWDAVVSRASDKKIKLEIALKEATEFHDALQAFVEWLTQAEKQLSSASAVSRVLETIQQQMEEHKILQKDVSIHRESMLLLDKKGTHLKYFSQKQDVILIKNLLVSVQHRWERVVAKAAERTRALDHGYKEAREFHDAWVQLITWLKETETTLDTLSEETSNDAIKIKKHLEKLREIQRNLQSKESFYDSTMRNGKGLMDRAPKTDEPVLSKMMNELKDSWKRVCHKSVERQRKFEEALLLSGQFADALQALLEWLRKAKTRLSEDGPVHGDLDTVTTLVDHHKQMESDLDKRSAQMQSVMKTGKDLEKSDETRETTKHLKELQKLWEDVQELSSRRKSRLEVALKEAERLHKSVHMLLEWLSEAEQKLRFVAAAPDDETQANDLLDEHARFMKELREKEYDKEETLGLANAILGKAHPDAVPIIKNWISIIQSRWDEISQWALNRQSKLEAQLKSLKDLDDSIEELLAWLAGLEATLLNLEQEPLPDEIPPLEALIADHKEFMENTARRQSEVDRACKPRQPPPGLKETRKPSRGVLKTPVRGSQPDLREHSPDYGTLGRKQSFKGSRDQGLNSRRTSRVSPGRETQTPERDRLPHYGPRFSQSNQPEAELRSPRAKLLWDKWRYVWMLAWERQRRLHDHLLYLQDLERVRQFSWEEWRKRFLKFMNHKKSRLTDLFRKMDKDNNGLIPREVFIDGIIGTKFDTSKLEMNAVADLFDRNGEGLIDWQEFIAALRPDWQDRKPANDADKIHDEVKRLVMLCTCRQKFRVFQVGEGKYRFGDSQKLRLVRILRSTVMVRVGGGWVALDEFLVKNDPCRVALVLPLPNPNDPRQHEACCPLSKGRTNIELREQFILADGVSQSMAAFKPRMSGSAGSGSTHAGSPIPTQGPIVKVRERSSKSISMSRPSRSSLSASTPDSLSDNESSIGTPGRFQTPNRKTSVPIRSQMTPGGSRTNSRPSSRPASRAGSKPPSRHGSTLSLDSTDDTTPSRIPTRRITSTTTPRPSRLSVGSTSGATRTTTTTNGVSSRTASGAASPAPTRNGGMSRSSSIPTLIGLPNSSQRSRIPVRQASNVSNSSSATGKTSGTSTPSGMQTPRRTSVEPQTPGSARPDRSSRGTTPIEKRAPFRL